MATIPASNIVSVVPNVLSAGGSALDMNGLILTTDTRIPIGTVASFASATGVGNYFGLSSEEAEAATVYFNGFENSNVKPGAVLMAQYPEDDVSAFLRGGNISGLSLAELQAISSGTLTIVVDGSSEVSGTITLSAATSFSDAASIIETAFTSPPFTVAYDSVSGAFIFTADSSGATSTIAFPTTNALATSLLLTQATGAVLSQGADATAPGVFMAGLVQITQNWATFMTIFDPDVSGNANKLAFAEWTNDQNDRFAYVCWDTDGSPSVTVPASTSLGYLLAHGDYSGTVLIGRDTADTVDFTYAAFICGTAASIDFAETDGRITFAFRRQSGLVATCTNETAADNLIANGYNFYGAYATANDDFVFFYPGSVTGDFLWADSYINEIWLNNSFQLAYMNLLIQVKSIPYNADGRALLEAAGLDPINAGLNFGAFRAGVTLSSAQAAEVNSAAGVKISDTLTQRGWYLQVLDASPEVRQARGTPPMTFWYMDGQSVQKINLTSVNVQ